MKKILVKQCHEYGAVRYGKKIPVNAVYGTSENGVVWICEDLNLYPDGIHIDIMLLVRKGGNVFWKEVRIAPKNRNAKLDEVYDALINFMTKNNLFGTEVKYPIGYKGTYQTKCPTGKKQVAVGLKEANKRHWNRGNGLGVVCDHAPYGGNPYTRGNKTGGLILYY